MGCSIQAISFFMPDTVLTNEELAGKFPDWSPSKIESKTGIKTRRVVNNGTCASDLAEQAILDLFKTRNIKPESIDFLLLATQSPDYFLPTTACILQDRLGIPKTAGALDFNLGCSAFIYGLALSKGLIESNVAKNVLLVTSETYSKYIHPMDKANLTIFGDAAAAALISECENGKIGSFVLGTDGSGWDKLIVPTGGARNPEPLAVKDPLDEGEIKRGGKYLFMDGPEIFNFTIGTVPTLVRETLEKNRIRIEDIDLFVFHQANLFIIEHLRKMIGIPKEKFYICLSDYGNTVSSTIPIALASAVKEGKLKGGMKVLLVGFGVGLSWGATVIDW